MSVWTQALIVMNPIFKIFKSPESFNFEKLIGNNLMKENRLVNINLKRSKAIAKTQKKKNNYYTFGNFLSVCDNF